MSSVWPRRSGSCGSIAGTLLPVRPRTAAPKPCADYRGPVKVGWQSLADAFGGKGFPPYILFTGVDCRSAIPGRHQRLS
jgi:hypothetical protein